MSSSSPSGSGGDDLSERRGIPAAKFIQDVETYLSQSGFDSNSALAFHQERLQQYKVVEMKLLAQQRDLQAKIPDIEKCLEVVATLEARKGTGEVELGCALILAAYLKTFSLKVLISMLACEIEHVVSQNIVLASLEESTETSFKSCLIVTAEHVVSRNISLLADFEVSEGIYSRACIEDTDSVCLWLGANVMLEYSCEEATALLRNNLENAKASLEVLVADLQFLRDQVTVTQVTIARIYNYDVHQRRVKQVTPTAIAAADA
ncbi:hypothetical protein HID58_084407 [Brassica napus]|uniref:Prefoldin subunit 3 n=1 Tax=Brassica napus TaxID=3708 RepID=A0ABQ7XJV8_BRANA|nr:hypothetical protein HID58_084407 [Brassica napus]